MIPTLRPFQLDLVERIRLARMRGARIIVMQAATGAGKTVTASHIVKLAVDKGTPTLFMVHRRKLVQQISTTLESFEINHGILMRGEQLEPNALVQVASRDTLLSRCVRNEWLGLPDARLVIVDEAHHAAHPQSEYRRILEQYPKATILLLTATPVGPDGKGMGPWAQAIECAAPTSQLIRDGYLVPLTVYAPDRKVDGKVRKRGIAGDLVESWKRYADGKRTILFLSRVEHSQEAVEAFAQEGIKFSHIDADTPDDNRERIFDDLEAGRLQGITNVGIVGEGVDIPSLECCQLYYNVGSRTRLLQDTGRIMRPLEGKSRGILIDHSAAVFRFGFPDEDQDWPLEGNADEQYQKKHDSGDVPEVRYCSSCEILFRDSPSCPNCGKMPKKPPRSVFAAPSIEATNEILTEADRSTTRSAWDRDEKIKHWIRCLAMVANRNNGTFAQARVIYKQKYSEYPADDFPVQHWDWKIRITDIYPNFRRRKAQ